MMNLVGDMSILLSLLQCRGPKEVALFRSA